MFHKYRAIYSKEKTEFHIVLDMEYELYEEMSDSTKTLYGYGDKTGRISPDDWNVERGEIRRDFRFFFGDFLAHTDTDRIFDLISDLFHGLTKSGINELKVGQLHKAKLDYIEYLSYNNFSLAFLERFANSKGIHFNRTLTTKSGQRLSVDSDITDICYVYESQSIDDIIFSSVHFALENGYKLAKCEHCEKYFFKSGSRAGSRQKFCIRKSPVPQYSHLNCEQAVRNIKQELQRKKKRIYNSMIREHESTEKFVYDFLDECAEYSSNIKETASAKNLIDYLNFLTLYKGGEK